MKNFGLKLKNNIFKIFIELFILNKKKRAHLKAKWAKRHLKKYTNMAVKDLSASIGADAAAAAGGVVLLAGKGGFMGPKGADILQGEEIIWQYWHQGKENAPELIQKCFESVEKFEGCKGFDGATSGKRVIVLSYDTIKDYIKLPEIYYKLLEAGKMKIAHFSDILRLYLLNEYGGLWVDSTIYLTGKIPESVWAADFCVMQKNRVCDPQQNKMSCYFIRARRGSLNILGILRALECYWTENDFILNYFMFEHISTMLYDMIPQLKTEWDNMPYLDANISGMMQERLYDTYDKNIWDEMVENTCIHKLSYKVIKEVSPGNTIYDFIIKSGAKKLVSVIIPTLQKDKKCLINLINTLLLDDAVGEIIVIDNSLKGVDAKDYNEDDRVRIITPDENLYVNPSWNLGVKEAKYEIAALINDDLGLPIGFCGSVIAHMTPEMGIVGLNADRYIKVVDKIDKNPELEMTELKKTNYMDLTYGAAMFFYKEAYCQIPDEIKIVYGDCWIFYKAIKAGRKNYKIAGQTVYHLGSLSSGDKVFNPVCKNDAKTYKRLMVKWYNRLLSYEETWFGYKIRVLGLTFMFPKKVIRRIFGKKSFGGED